METNTQIGQIFSSDICYYIVILAIIIIFGLLGGLASFYLNDTKEKSKPKSLVLGLVASFIVPLFLNMISSNLLIEAKKQIDKLFIFAGFCILASVFSKNFLENIYNKVIQKVNEIDKKVENIEQSQSELDIPEKAISDEILKQKDLTKAEYELLKILSSGKFTYRSIPGLKKESSLVPFRNSVENSINKLIANGLIDSRIMNENQHRYFISSEGRKRLGEVIANYYNKINKLSKK